MNTNTKRKAEISIEEKHINKFKASNKVNNKTINTTNKTSNTASTASTTNTNTYTIILEDNNKEFFNFNTDITNISTKEKDEDEFPLEFDEKELKANNMNIDLFTNINSNDNNVNNDNNDNNVKGTKNHDDTNNDNTIKNTNINLNVFQTVDTNDIDNLDEQLKYDLKKANDLPTIQDGQILKIISWNVNGIRANQTKGNFDNFLQKGNYTYKK